MEEKEIQIHPFVDKRIEDYCQTFHSKQETILNELERTTHLKFLRPNMISGSWQGELLKILTQLVNPKRVLEIGTFSGYSTMCFCLSSQSDCVIDTIEAVEDYKSFLENLFLENNFAQKVNLHFGQAIDVIPRLNNSYDMIFIDADKANYPNYYSLVADKINKGGLLVADNILWYGKVAISDAKDKETLAIRKFNQMITEDNRFENVILPIRDGLMIARRV